MKKCIPYIFAGLASCWSVAEVSAVEIEMYFQATIQEITDEFEGQARVGDSIIGTIIFDTNTPASVDFPSEYPGAVTFFDIGIIQPDPDDPSSGFYSPLISGGSTGTNIFVGTNSFEIGYFVDIFTGNFQVYLNNGPEFNNSLMTAGAELVQATEDSPFDDALDAFADPFENSSFTIQTDYTFGNTFATFDFVQFSEVPEPSSLALLGLGGLCMIRGGRRP